MPTAPIPHEVVDLVQVALSTCGYCVLSTADRSGRPQSVISDRVAFLDLQSIGIGIDQIEFVRPNVDDNGWANLVIAYRPKALAAGQAGQIHATGTALFGRAQILMDPGDPLFCRSQSTFVGAPHRPSLFVVLLSVEEVWIERAEIEPRAIS